MGSGLRFCGGGLADKKNKSGKTTLRGRQGWSWFLATTPLPGLALPPAFAFPLGFLGGILSRVPTDYGAQ